MTNKSTVPFQVVWRVCNLFMSLFFALASYVQINDPDAVLWMIAYAVPAGLCFSICCQQQITETLLWRRIADLHVLVASTFVFILGWNLYKEKITNIFQQEEGREFSGLLLTVFWLLVCRHSGRCCWPFQAVDGCGNHCISIHHMDLLPHQHRAEIKLA
ncbi:Transmembrane protein 220 [Triplophysa tibetana]|uniref:Transmembrane protein 220 n=1 Tax=Triplophysa tibetana TaxID=1572043 RepID=A0A5A9NA66_9TELE|nr:Transmembrane protein 220 [Triplophysa tibetana]